MVHHIQLQPAAGALVLGLTAADQLIPSPRHRHEAYIGPGQNAVKPSHLDIGFQGHFVFPWHGPVGSMGQGPDPYPLLLHLLPLLLQTG